jgi:DNA-binding transcriptional ArsR family regulator
MARERVAVDVFFARGDQVRLSLVRKLGAAGALSGTALANGANVTGQAIVKHLQVLEYAGLVSREKHGREVLYALEMRRLEDARLSRHHLRRLGSRARSLAAFGRRSGVSAKIEAATRFALEHGARVLDEKNRAGFVAVLTADAAPFDV